MPQYLVTTGLARADPLLPLDRLAGLLREAILPSLPSVESLIDLRSRGTIVTGGYPMGHRSIVFVMQAESEEELFEILKKFAPLEPGEGQGDSVTEI
jgi:hypothetical protein